nr:ELL-associated factor 1 [Tanacetum cinerariifolium]
MSNNNNKKDEPPVDRWFDLTLGSSFQDNPSSKFCTLRYEFKPASIDKNQPGKLHKTSDNKVAVEFQNNQPGKPKVSFEGSSEDYKDNDAVLFFDGESFRLERLHRSVKRLRHVRQPGESAGMASAAGVSGLQPEASSPPLGKAPKVQSSNKNFLPATVEVERIEIGNFKSFGMEKEKIMIIQRNSMTISLHIMLLVKECDKAPIVIEKDNPKVKPAVVKEKPDDVTSKVSKGKELDVLKYKRRIEKESNALDNPNESDKGPVSESHVNHMELQRKTKPDVVKAPVAKAKANVVKAPVAKDNHMGFKMNYMEGQELNEITCDCRRITRDSR